MFCFLLCWVALCFAFCCVGLRCVALCCVVLCCVVLCFALCCVLCIVLWVAGSQDQFLRISPLISSASYQQVQAQVKAADPEGQAADNLVKCSSVAEGSNCTTWLVGKWLSAKDQAHAPKGCLMLYFCFPPPQFVRADVTYLNIGCLSVDTNRVEGLGNCTADLDRGVFHACHVGTIVHALEGWKHHETGEVDVAQMEVTWEAAQRYGFSLVPEVARVVRAGSWDTRSNSSTESPKATPTMTVEEVKVPCAGLGCVGKGGEGGCLPQPRWAVCATGGGAHQGQTSREGERDDQGRPAHTPYQHQQPTQGCPGPPHPARAPPSPTQCTPLRTTATLVVEET